MSAVDDRPPRGGALRQQRRCERGSGIEGLFVDALGSQGPTIMSAISLNCTERGRFSDRRGRCFAANLVLIDRGLGFLVLWVVAIVDSSLLERRVQDLTKQQSSGPAYYAPLCTATACAGLQSRLAELLTTFLRFF